MSAIQSLPFIPLRSSMLTPRMVQESLAEQAQTEDQGDDKADMLQRAHAMNVARARGGGGQTSTSSQWGGQGASPFSQHVQQAKQAAAAPVTHDWGDEPAGHAGGVTISMGTGRDPTAFAQGRRQAEANLGPGETLHQNDDMSYSVGGLASGGARAGSKTDPVVNLVNSFKSALPPEALKRVQSFADTGATPVQVHEALQHEMQAAQVKPKPSNNSEEREATNLQASLLEKQIDAIKHKFPEIGNADADDSYKADRDYAPMKQQYLQLKPQLDQINAHRTEAAWKPPTAGEGIPHAPTKNAKLVDFAIRDQFLKAANGDKMKAIQMAKDAGWSL